MAKITVQISEDLILGPWEILNTLSAALFGPIGEYRLEPVTDGVRVIYRQAGETSDSLLLRPWMSRARSEAVRFAEGLEAYIRSPAQ